MTDKTILKPKTTAAQLAHATAAPAVIFDPRAFRNALGGFATGVTIVTTKTADGHNIGLTCNSFASVSLSPPLVLWSLGTTSSNLAAFQAASYFTINILAHTQGDLALKFARSGHDKFAGLNWTPGLGGAPVLAGCAASFQCCSADRYAGGDHIIFLGAVEAFAHTADAPLLFSRGKFGAFAPDAT